ncbi:MAG: hypothetical protein ACOCR1_01280 [Planctomycetota bacterium]
MRTLNAMIVMLAVGLMGALTTQQIQANGGRNEMTRKEAVRNYMIEALSMALEDPDVKLVVVETVPDADAPPLEDGRSVDDVRNYYEIIKSLGARGGMLRTDLKLLEVIRGDKKRFAERLFVSPLTRLDGSLDRQRPSFGTFALTRWVLFLKSPFDGESSRERAVMKKFRELKAGTFLNRRNFFLPWIPPGKKYEAFFCLYWPSKEELKEAVSDSRKSKLEMIEEAKGWGLEAGDGVPMATKQLPGDIKTILEFMEDEDRELVNHAEELLKKISDPYARGAVKRMVQRRRHKKELQAFRKKVKPYLIEALADFLENRDTVVALSNQWGLLPNDIVMVVRWMEKAEPERREGLSPGHAVITAYGNEVFQRMRMLDLTGNLESKVQVIEALGKAFEGGRIVLPDLVEGLSESSRKILEVIDDEEHSVRDREKALRAAAEKSGRARNKLERLLERREEIVEKVIEAFEKAIEGLEMEFPISEHFADDLKMIVNASEVGKPISEKQAEKLRDSIRDPYVLKAFERMMKRRARKQKNDGDDDDDETTE